MNTVQLHVTLSTDGDPAAIGELVAVYLSHPDWPLRADYCPPASDEDGRSDGYPGPFLLDVKVVTDAPVFGGPVFTELSHDYGFDRYGPVPVGRWADVYEVDESRCTRCDIAIGSVLEADDNGHDRCKFIGVWEDPLLQGYCEDCAIDIETGTPIEPFPGEYGYAVPGGDGAVAGVDYEAGCCPICGGTDSPANHNACLDQLGVWPEPSHGGDE